jgi:hypothetical protein
MKEGYWINFRTGKVFPIEEHETWLREKGNAKRLGVPPGVIRAFPEFKPATDRDKFLLFVMQHSPIMRVRGHGTFVTFEYASHERGAAMDAVWLWAKENAGPFTALSIVNLETREKTEMFYQDFEHAMDEGGAEAVMRAASVGRFDLNRRIARELIFLAKKMMLA